MSILIKILPEPFVAYFCRGCIKVHTRFGKSCMVMEIENVIFQDLESFERERERERERELALQCRAIG